MIALFVVFNCTFWFVSWITEIAGILVFLVVTLFFQLLLISIFVRGSLAAKPNIRYLLNWFNFILSSCIYTLTLASCRVCLFFHCLLYNKCLFAEIKEFGVRLTNSLVNIIQTLSTEITALFSVFIYEYVIISYIPLITRLWVKNKDSESEWLYIRQTMSFHTLYNYCFNLMHMNICVLELTVVLYSVPR